MFKAYDLRKKKLRMGFYKIYLEKFSVSPPVKKYRCIFIVVKMKN